MRLSLISLFVAYLVALPAHALVVPPLPTGDCALDTSQPFDRTASNYMHLATQTPGVLKALFTECGDLEKLRAQRLLYLSYYAAVIEQKDPLTPGTTRAQVIKTLSDAVGLSGAMAAKAMNAGDPSLTSLTRNASYHGILKQSEQMIILGSEQRHVGARAPYMAATVTALTVVDGRLVSVNFYAPFTAANTYDVLAARAESYVNSLLAVNP